MGVQDPPQGFNDTVEIVARLEDSNKEMDKKLHPMPSNKGGKQARRDDDAMDATPDSANAIQATSNKKKNKDGKNDKDSRKPLTCYRCNGPHVKRDCPYDARDGNIILESDSKLSEYGKDQCGSTENSLVK